jgi:magnesium-transporting ATPase (P-type)
MASVERPVMDLQLDHAPVTGLTEAEAEARRRRGEANTAVSGHTRSYATILRTNVFNFFNVILFVIGIALLALGRYSDALISVGLGLINAVISAVQEIRAKRKLDRLQLLDQARSSSSATAASCPSAPRRSSVATRCGYAPATRSWSTARCSTPVASRRTSRC